jgi:hypothetical protein
MAAMKWIVVVSLMATASALAIASRVREHDVARAVVAGMLGPVMIIGVTWAQAARIHRTGPARLTAFLMTAFFVKVVLFGAYVAVALRVLDLPGYPFIVSFAGYFVMLYASEAVWLSRLAQQAPDARS